MDSDALREWESRASWLAGLVDDLMARAERSMPRGEDGRLTPGAAELLSSLEQQLAHAAADRLAREAGEILRGREP